MLFNERVGVLLLLAPLAFALWWIAPRQHSKAEECRLQVPGGGVGLPPVPMLNEKYLEVEPPSWFPASLVGIGSRSQSHDGVMIMEDV